MNFDTECDSNFEEVMKVKYDIKGDYPMKCTVSFHVDSEREAQNEVDVLSHEKLHSRRNIAFFAYLVVHAILTNDLPMLECFLHNTHILPNYCSLRWISRVERSIYGGFRGSDGLKAKFEQFTNSDVKTKDDFFLSFSDGIDIKNDGVINILALACYFGNIQIIKLIARKIKCLTCHVFVAIICHPYVTAEQATYLIKNAKYHFNKYYRFRHPEKSNNITNNSNFNL